MNPTVRDFVLRLVIVFGIFFAVGLLSGPGDRPHRPTFGDFLAAVQRGDIEHRARTWKTGWPSPRRPRRGADPVQPGDHQRAEDLEAVSATARDMVMRFGMGRGLGAPVFGSDTTQPLVGPALSRPPDHSQQSARDIDDEIGRLVARASEAATQILEPLQAQLHVMAGVPLERETLGRAEFVALLARTPVTDEGRVLRFRPRGQRQTEAAEAI